MLTYFLKRLLMAIPVMFVVAIFVFLLLRLTPGDPAMLIAGDEATLDQLDAIRAAMGLNDPLWVQFWTWLGKVAQGDFGISLISGKEVMALIAQRVGPTLSLAVTAMAITLLAALPLGVAAAWQHGRLLDRLVMIFSVLGFSVPVFVTGYVLIAVFAVNLKWFPVQGYKPLSDGLGVFSYRIFLPALTLASIYIALIARMTRAAMLETLQEDFIRTARAKGLGERIVLFRHALRNAAIPILTVIGTGFAMMVSGVVVTESVFNIPGLGRLVVDAVQARDYPLIQAIILMTAGIYVLINLLIDLSYALTDPRVRYK